MTPPFWDSDPALKEEGDEERERHAEATISLADFRAYMPKHEYIYTPTGDLWPAASVNARIAPIVIGTDQKGKPKTMRANAYLDRYQPVEKMIWAPGLPMDIHDRLLLDGGWVQRPGTRCFNLYLAPQITPGRVVDAQPWVGHVQLLYPDGAEHIFDYLACRVQRPEVKINHALLLGGPPGIGKDSILAPVRHAVGPSNFREASPRQVLGQFTWFLKAVILRVSEGRDLGEFDRFALYEHMKTYLASPPEVLIVNEKNKPEYPILNCCGVVITTNHKTDGLYLPADDRRHFVAWSDLQKEDERLQGDYWNRLHGYYEHGGNEAVAAFLWQRDIRHFDPKAPPPLTPAFWAIADAYRPSEEAELADLIDRLGNPDALTLAQLIDQAADVDLDRGLGDWLKDRKNRPRIPHRLENCGYERVHNTDRDDGLWSIRRRRQAVYADRRLPLRDQIAAARQLAGE